MENDMTFVEDSMDEEEEMYTSDSDDDDEYREENQRYVCGVICIDLIFL